MSKGALKGKSIFELGQDIQQAVDGQVHKNSPSIVAGIKPKKRILDEGYHILKPDELSALLVPALEVSGGIIHGFQREPKRPQIRKIARAIANGKILPPIEVAIYRNANWIVDGQQRAFGCVIANESAPVLARKLTAEQMHQLFADQGKAMPVNPSYLVLSADDAFSEYVQDAVTSSDNPWSTLITSSLSSTTKLTPKQGFDSITQYVTNTLGEHVGKRIDSHKFDEHYADELATLFMAFGTKKTNPLAYRPIGIRAITYAGTLIIRRNGSRPRDIERWQTWMPKFPWSEYVTIRKSKELAYFLVRHWNKNLAPENKLPMPEDLQ